MADNATSSASSKGLRFRLQELSPALAGVFQALTDAVSPLLASIPVQFPEFTRHGPAHSQKLEGIATQLLKAEVVELMSAEDVFALLCALWLHDAGMGLDERLRDDFGATHGYRERLSVLRRLGLDEDAAWRQYVREAHPLFCPPLADRFLGGRVPPHLVPWIGRIAASHGAQEIHRQDEWPSVVAVADGAHIHPALLAAVLRLSDILHFNEARAPEYMLEHRQIRNTVSLAHWRAHQAAADFTIENGVCFFDGETKDDEAYWFAKQFIEAMDEELSYCIRFVFPNLAPELRRPLAFWRVHSRLRAVGFVGDHLVTLRVQPDKILGELISTSLYSGQPVWFREVLQNAFDACRDRAALDGSEPRVRIVVDSAADTLTIEDTGVGMLRSTVEGFLLVAGASFWQSEAYRASVERPVGHVGKFGVGFMSLIAVADRIVVTSRHVSAPGAWRYLVREAGKVIRVERADRAGAGTSIEVSLRAGTLAEHDPLELYEKYCSFPEFQTELVIDSVVRRATHEVSPPSVETSPLRLTKVAPEARRARLMSSNLEGPGIRGDLHVPKVHVEALGAFVPTIRGWERGGGWELLGESAVILGGVTYPMVHALDNLVGFTHIPSLGVVRVAVSPNDHPLEMNLSRDRYVTGPAAMRFHHELCVALDRVLAADLVGELADVGDPQIRSAVASRHSASMLELWLGQVPEPTSVVHGAGRRPTKLARTPWAELTRCFERELRFVCLGRDQKVTLSTLEQLVAEGRVVFAAPVAGRNVPVTYARAVFEFAPDATLLVARPDADFGIRELRLWANEEFLVPVDENARSAYGLRLGVGARPYPLYPAELTTVGIPVGAGPERYALLDYRDFMAEAKARPTGGPEIVGVLNRRNAKVMPLLEALMAREQFSKTEQATLTNLREVLVIGRDGRYGVGAQTRVLGGLNDLARSFGVRGVQFVDRDVPSYFDGEEVRPFGPGAVLSTTVAALEELGALELPRIVMS